MATTPQAETDHVGFSQQVKSLDDRYWIVNAMEMFERLAYYGVRAVIALYIIWPPEKGGLQFTHVEKGAIFAWWAYIQSMLPVFTGGFADRYGHKNTVAVSIAVKIAGYICMAVFRDFGGFFLGCMLLAGGTAIFKPGVQGTLAYTLKKGNASVGWGIFYQVVNIGGFFGPVLAGFLRGWDWQWVFISCAIIVAINYLWLPFYKEPTKEPDYAEAAGGGKSLTKVTESVPRASGIAWLAIHGALLVASIALAVFTEIDIMLSVMLILTFGIFTFGFLMFLLRREAYATSAGDPLSVFVLSVVGVFQHRVFWFIIAFSGFWLMFNQVFDLLPNVIDDWMDTSMIIGFIGDSFSSPTVPTLVAVLLGLFFGAAATIIILLAMRPDRRAARDIPLPAYIVVFLGVAAALWIVGLYLGTPWNYVGLAAGIPVTATLIWVRLGSKWVALAAMAIGSVGAFLVVREALIATAPELVQLAKDGAQVNPEWMINANPLLIMTTMFVFAYLSSFVKPLTSILLGMAIATLGSYIAGSAALGTICLGGIFIFSVGEMLSSPKKMEYLASVAKPGQQALFMGYANMPVAIGWIVGSFVAGSLYESGGDKISLARQYLFEQLGVAQDAIAAIGENDMMTTLAAKLNVSVSEAQDVLWNTYDPWSIWLIIAGIGIGSIALMVGYTLFIRAHDRKADVAESFK